MKPLNSLLRKVADNLIFPTNKLRHGGTNQRALYRFFTLFTFSLYVKTNQCFMEMLGVSAGIPREPVYNFLEKAHHLLP